jgi:hypothetical protein
MIKFLVAKKTVSPDLRFLRIKNKNIESAHLSCFPKKELETNQPVTADFDRTTKRGKG